MKMSLLEMVQYLLSSMGSDEVNDLNETEESYELALLIKQVYYDSVTELDLHEHETLFELVPFSDPTNTPAVMQLPAHVTDVAWLEYDGVRQQYQDLEAFASSTGGDATQRVENSRGESFTFRYDTTSGPTAFTSFDDNTMVFNAIDVAEDHSLQACKSRGYGYAYSPWKMENTFIPDLKPRHFPYLINRAKVRAFAEIHQVANKEAASETRAQKLEIRRSGAALEDGRSIWNNRIQFGRRGRR